MVGRPVSFWEGFLVWFEKCCVLDVGLAGWQPNYFVKTLGGMSSQFSDNGKGVISRVKTFVEFTIVCIISL